jgi:eukaryotic-like serine/threonine-protein kinase
MADPREELQSGLADRYVIERELGRGGMATVYLARDRRYDRPVALKVLHAELGNTLGPERFQREIQLAARLQHPHILTVLDSGEVAASTGTRLWFTMPYVEGESLRDRLRRERQLPLEDALRIAREAAQALQYAHRHDVVHRDIKPENIMVTADGHTLVADFGIARATGGRADGRTGGEQEERLTDTGLTLGTPAYMSPEQASGARELDGRTDIYSLGAVLYEMLAGEAPFSGPTAQAMLARRVLEDAPPLRQRRPSAPESVERAVAKALARTPADRFSSAGDFARALEASEPTRPMATTSSTSSPATPAPSTARAAARRVPSALAFVLGLLVTATMGMLVWRQTHRAAPAGADGSRVVAVLPFENLGGPEQEYFADGVTDAIRGKLAAIPGLQVIARSSSSPYKGAGKSPTQIADELGAQYLLTGTVRWEKGAGGNRVQVSPELVQVRSGGSPTTQWQQPFSAGITDVFEVQADIAKQVAEALDLQLGETQREVLSERPTANLAAYDAFLRGEELYAHGGGDPDQTRAAIAAFERAVALDTGFVLAWAQLARANSQLYGNAGISVDVADAARQAAERASKLAPGNPEALLALADYYSYVTADNAKALEQYALAQRSAPNNAEILSGAALSELSLGRWEESLAHFQRALELDPRAARTAARTARTLVWLRRYPEALAMSDRAIALAPTSTTTFENKVMVYLAQGDLEGARRVLRSAPASLDPTSLVATVAQFWDLFWVLEEPQQHLLLRLGPSAFGESREGWGLALASTYALRGDQARARAYADSARIALEGKLSQQEDAQLRVLLGTALAYLGRRDDAVHEGERAVAMLPMSREAFVGPYIQHQLARIYLLVGEPDKALDRLEPLLRVPYFLSPAWLRIDPTFDPLRKNPRFQRLLSQAAP